MAYKYDHIVHVLFIQLCSLLTFILLLSSYGHNRAAQIASSVVDTHTHIERDRERKSYKKCQCSQNTHISGKFLSAYKMKMSFSTYFTEFVAIALWWSRTETPLKVWRQNIKQQNISLSLSFTVTHSVRLCIERLFRGLRTSTKWKIPSEWAFAWHWTCLLPHHSHAGKKCKQQKRELCIPENKVVGVNCSFSSLNTESINNYHKLENHFTHTLSYGCIHKFPVLLC